MEEWDEAPLKEIDPPPLERYKNTHRGSRGSRKKWRPRTQRCRRIRLDEWTPCGIRERWRGFKATAGIDGRMTITSARIRFREKGIHPNTLLRWIFGHTDVKLSSAIDACDAWGCTLEGFAKGMKEAWEMSERKWAIQDALDAARREAQAQEESS